MLDRLIPKRSVTCRRRPSDPWFDQECREAKRRVRRLERIPSRTSRVAAVPDATSAAAAWTAERHAYRDLLQRKREAFWQTKIDAERSAPQRMWQSIDALMGRGHVPLSTSVDARQLHRFFHDKVAGVRASTADAPLPSFTTATPGCMLSTFQTLDIEDVATAIHKLPDKQCTSDPIPMCLLKDNADLLAPFITELCNRSLSSGVFPTPFKSAFITPLLKKSDMDPADCKSYRPISNLSVLSKTVEHLVARQLVDHLNLWKLMPDLQSAYRAHHSTETAVLRVFSDILGTLDRGDFAVLTLLDLSAAFDTVDHETLLQRLETSYRIRSTVLSWFASYLHDRQQFVHCRSSTSIQSYILYGVPQGSVLGLILFLLYTVDLIKLVKVRDRRPHLYADDTQLYGFCSPDRALALEE